MWQHEETPGPLPAATQGCRQTPPLHSFWSKMSKHEPAWFNFSGISSHGRLQKGLQILQYYFTLLGWLKRVLNFYLPPFRSHAIWSYLISIPRLDFTAVSTKLPVTSGWTGGPGRLRKPLRVGWLSNLRTSFWLLLMMKRENSFAFNYDFSGRGEWSFGTACVL